MLKKLIFKIRLWFRPRSSVNIYAFHDGSNWRTCDPLAVIYTLAAHPTYNDAKHFKAAYNGDREALLLASQAVSDAFGVKAYDPETRTGLTIGERFGLLVNFARYLDALKKNTEPSLT